MSEGRSLASNAPAAVGELLGASSGGLATSSDWSLLLAPGLAMREICEEVVY